MLSIIVKLKYKKNRMQAPYYYFLKNGDYYKLLIPSNKIKTLLLITSTTPPSIK